MTKPKPVKYDYYARLQRSYLDHHNQVAWTNVPIYEGKSQFNQRILINGKSPQGTVTAMNYILKLCVPVFTNNTYRYTLLKVIRK